MMDNFSSDSLNTASVEIINCYSLLIINMMFGV
jgi:hypothetical protein